MSINVPYLKSGNKIYKVIRYDAWKWNENGIDRVSHQIFRSKHVESLWTRRTPFFVLERPLINLCRFSDHKLWTTPVGIIKILHTLQLKCTVARMKFQFWLKKKYCWKQRSISQHQNNQNNRKAQVRKKERSVLEPINANLFWKDTSHRIF